MPRIVEKQINNMSERNTVKLKVELCVATSVEGDEVTTDNMPAKFLTSIIATLSN